MDPQAYVRLTVGSLGLRLPNAKNSPCTCDIRLSSFATKTLTVPLISSSSELNNPDRQNETTPTDVVFYLEESKLKEPGSSGCFKPSNGSYIEIIVYDIRGKKKKRQKIGTVRLEVGPGFNSGGKPVLLHNGWVAIRGCKNAELHLWVKVEPDPRYVFRFEDEIMSSPQVVQVQGNMIQPIFSCKFSCDRRRAEMDESGMESEDIVRKGWKVVVHDLSGSSVAVAFMATPFVPSTGSDHVDRSNPGAWLIVRPDPVGSLPGASWHPWARLEAWRENSDTARCHDSVCLRLRVLPDVELSEMHIRCDRGGEFMIDMDSEGWGYVMDCRVGGEEGRRGKIGILQVAVRHVTCVEDAAVFVALAAAADLSVKACRRFCRKPLARSSRDVDQ